jgi:hypothetical protein
LRGGGVVSPFTTIGSGNNTVGYWLGDLATNRLVVAPKSTEVQGEWGSSGTDRNTTSTTNGVANTTTLHSYGSAAHPAAYYCRALTTGGYNTWYLPAKNELMVLYSNKSAVPFATANSFGAGLNWSSTEYSSSSASDLHFGNGNFYNHGKDSWDIYVRAARRSTI